MKATTKTMKVRKVYSAIFEDVKAQELIIVHYEDLDGYIHYEYCDDPTKQIYTMTPVQLFNKYERMKL